MAMNPAPKFCRECQDKAMKLYNSFCTHDWFCLGCGLGMMNRGQPCRKCGSAINFEVQDYDVPVVFDGTIGKSELHEPDVSCTNKTFDNEGPSESKDYDAPAVTDCMMEKSEFHQAEISCTNMIFDKEAPLESRDVSLAKKEKITRKRKWRPEKMRNDSPKRLKTAAAAGSFSRRWMGKFAQADANENSPERGETWDYEQIFSDDEEIEANEEGVSREYEGIASIFKELLK